MNKHDWWCETSPVAWTCFCANMCKHATHFCPRPAWGSECQALPHDTRLVSEALHKLGDALTRLTILKAGSSPVKQFGDQTWAVHRCRWPWLDCYHRGFWATPGSYRLGGLRISRGQIVTWRLAPLRGIPWPWSPCRPGNPPIIHKWSIPKWTVELIVERHWRSPEIK